MKKRKQRDLKHQTKEQDLSVQTLSEMVYRKIEGYSSKVITDEEKLKELQ